MLHRDRSQMSEGKELVSGMHLFASAEMQGGCGCCAGSVCDCQRFGIARLAGRGERVPMVPYACMYTSAATLLLKATLVMLLSTGKGGRPKRKRKIASLFIHQQLRNRAAP